MPPLCVDLDGTLVKTDTLWESYLLLLKQNMFIATIALFQLLRGKAAFKNYLAERTHLDVATLPYNQDLLAWLKAEKKRRTLILVTASNQKIANSIAEYLGLFDEVVGSTVANQMNAHNKDQLLVEKYGAQHYDYVGNHKKDLPVWQQAKSAYVANAKASVVKKANQQGNVAEVFSSKKLTVKQFLKAIRVHQYVKNLLLFVPLMMSFQPSNVDLLAQYIIGFFAFCLLASGIYVLNDLLDLRSDRLHDSKKNRAIAAGLISIPMSMLLVVVFVVLAVLLAIDLPIKFQAILLLYFLLTISYSFYLKKHVLVDVLVLASLYTIRIVAGMILLNNGYSEWLIMFSVFVFLSLAFLKRYTELNALLAAKKLQTVGRGYHVNSIEMIRNFGITSGYLAALIIAFYLNSSKALIIYRHPQVLWLISMVMLYWVSRIWLLASEGKVHEDPVVFAIKDKVSYLLILCIIVLITLALW